MEVGVKWDESTATPRVPIKTSNVLEAGNVSDDATKKHYDLVWTQTEYGDGTPEYGKEFDSILTSTVEFKSLHNGTTLKHVMAGKKIWSSLTTDFQVELIGHDHIFKRGKCRDVALLWKSLLKHMCPTTKVLSSNPK